MFDVASLLLDFTNGLVARGSEGDACLRRSAGVMGILFGTGWDKAGVFTLASAFGLGNVAIGFYMSKFEQIIPSCDYWWDFVEARKVLFYLKVVTK